MMKKSPSERHRAFSARFWAVDEEITVIEGRYDNDPFEDRDPLRRSTGAA